jgi:hypothetical protein
MKPFCLAIGLGVCALQGAAADDAAPTLYVVRPLAPGPTVAIAAPSGPRVIIMGEGSRAGTPSQAPLEPLPRPIPLVRFDPILPPTPHPVCDIRPARPRRRMGT